MDLKLFLVSFAAVFISQQGDKSQMTEIDLGGSSHSPKAVNIGTASALMLAYWACDYSGQKATSTINPYHQNCLTLS